MGWDRVHTSNVIYNNRRIEEMIIITIISGILIGRMLGKWIGDERYRR